LSYLVAAKWRVRQDSNLQPSDPKAHAIRGNALFTGVFYYSKAADRSRQRQKPDKKPDKMHTGNSWMMNWSVMRRCHRLKLAVQVGLHRRVSVTIRAEHLNTYHVSGPDP